MSNDESAIQVLRAGSTIAIVFLVIYLVDDLVVASRREPCDRDLPLGNRYRGADIFRRDLDQRFRDYWKLWNLLFCIVVISIFIMISAQTHEGDSRFVAVCCFRSRPPRSSIGDGDGRR